MMAKGFAPAKINLYLHVAAPRADGLHPLDSLVAFAADVGDVVTAALSDALSIEVSGPFAGALSGGGDNLVLRAARALAERADVAPRAALHLEKNLPIASGIGGGSSDAAAALRVLNVLWDVKASDDDLEALAAGLGADVPACVRARTARMHGIGELLIPTELPPLHAVLANSGDAAPTGQVYRAFDAAGAFGALDASTAPSAGVLAWLAAQRNDLEAAAQVVAPTITETLSVLTQAAPAGALVRMSGSGATCFALVENALAAEALAQSVAVARPKWWVRPARLGAVDVGSGGR
jgi:4-diphosphocytidyl-2-C-methyl-D-erythritol kinase